MRQVVKIIMMEHVTHDLKVFVGYSHQRGVIM